VGLWQYTYTYFLLVLPDGGRIVDGVVFVIERCQVFSFLLCCCGFFSLHSRRQKATRILKTCLAAETRQEKHKKFNIKVRYFQYEALSVVFFCFPFSIDSLIQIMRVA
jgi:hypothetical protein